MPIIKLPSDFHYPTNNGINVGQKVFRIDGLTITEYCVVSINGTQIRVTDSDEDDTVIVHANELGLVWFKDKIALENAIQRLLEEVKKELL